VYDSEGVLLKSSRTSDYIIGGEIKMQPGSDLRRMGFRRGKYKVKYNFLRRKAGDDKYVVIDSDNKIFSGDYHVDDDGRIYKGKIKPIDGSPVVELAIKPYKYFIHDISKNRSEIRIAPIGISDYRYKTPFSRLGSEWITTSPAGDVTIDSTDPTILHFDADSSGFNKRMKGGFITIKNAFLVGYEQTIVGYNNIGPNESHLPGDSHVP
jgi:hypothetical protein